MSFGDENRVNQPHMEEAFLRRYGGKRGGLEKERGGTKPPQIRRRVLKQMPAPPVHAIELSGVAAQKLPHHPYDGGVSGSQQQVQGLGSMAPCVTGSLGFTQDPLQPLAEVIAVAIPPKILRRSIPRPMTGCKAPGASTRALGGRINSYHRTLKPVPGLFPALSIAATYRWFAATT
jgi:hypothetical protein